MGTSLDVILEPVAKTFTVIAGNPATFYCTVTGGDLKNYQMSWYKKSENNALFLVYKLNNNSTDDPMGNFKGKINISKSQFILDIQKATMKDAGVYYCGSDIGGSSWDTRQMFFGAGIKLFVEPQKQPPAKPSVFIMKNGTNVACLVKDFYPKDVNISLRSSKKIAEFDPAIAISPSGKYSAVKLGQYGDSNSVTCSVQHNSETVHSTDFEQYADSVDNVKPTEPAKNDTQTSEPCHSPRVMIHAKKVNTMSLTVLGLRLLLAKTVAINFLLTAKLFF